MKKIILMLSMALGFTMNAQIEDFQDFESASYPELPLGWTSSQTNQSWGDWPDVVSQVDYVCEGSSAAAYSADPWNHPDAWLKSPMYIGNIDHDINVSFILGVRDNFTSLAPNFNWGTITFEYSTDNGSTWVELANFTEESDLNCSLKSYNIPSTDFDSELEIIFKWTFTYDNEEGQWTAQIDNFTVNQIGEAVNPCEDYTTPTGDTEQTLDEGQTLADLEVTADEDSELTWYADEDLTEEVNPEEIQPENGDIFYVTQSNEDCTSEALAITITVTAGLNEAQMAELKVYPNPASDMINVSYKSTIESLTVMDLTGRKVHQQAINAQETTLDIQSLSTGTYLMNIQTTDGVGIVKFIKK